MKRHRWKEVSTRNDERQYECISCGCTKTVRYDPSREQWRHIYTTRKNFSSVKAPECTGELIPTLFEKVKV